MNRRSQVGLTLAGTFAVFALIRSFWLSWLPGSLSDPANSRAAVPLVSCLRIFRTVQREHAILSALRTDEIYLGGINLTKEMPIAYRKSENLSHSSPPFAL